MDAFEGRSDGNSTLSFNACFYRLFILKLQAEWAVHVRGGFSQSDAFGLFCFLSISF